MTNQVSEIPLRLEDKSAAEAAQLANIEQDKAKMIKIKSTLSKLSSALLSSAIPGEDPVIVNTPNLQLTAQRDMPRDMDNKELTLPHSADSSITGSEQRGFTIPDSFSTSINPITGQRLMDSDIAMDVKAISYKQNIYAFAGKINTEVISLEFVQGSKEVEVFGLSEPIVIRMDNAVAASTPKTIIPVVNLVQLCPNVSLVDLIFPCPHGDIIIPCTAGSENSQVSIDCPTKELIPSCLYFDIFSQSWASEGCVLDRETSTTLTTICHCTHLTDFASELTVAFSEVEEHVTAVLSNEENITIYDLKPNVVIFFALWSFVFLVFGIFAYRWDRVDAAARLTEKNNRLDKAEPIRVNQMFLPSAFAGAPNWKAIAQIYFARVLTEIKQNEDIVSIVCKYDQSSTRPQRLTVVITMSMCQMFFIAFLFILKQGEPSLFEMFMSAVIPAGVMLPVSMIFNFLFKNSAKTQKQIIQYKYDDMAGHVSHINVDGHGKCGQWSPFYILAMDLNYLGQTITLPALQSFASYCKVLFLNVDMVSMKDSRAGQILEALYLILNDESNSMNSINFTEKSTANQLYNFLTEKECQIFHTKLQAIDLTTMPPQSFIVLGKYLSDNSLALTENKQVDELKIIELLYQFIKKIYECSVAFHENLNVRQAKAKLDVEHAQLQLLESKKAIPMASDGGMAQVVQMISAQTNLDKAVADLKHIQSLVKHEAQCLKKQQNDEFKAITSSLSWLATWKTWWGLTRKQKNERRLKTMPLNEQHAFQIEQAEMDKLGWFARKLYRWFIKHKSHHIAAPLFPDWANYIFYALCAGMCIGCGYYIFLFIMYVSENEANLWIGSVLLSLFLSYLIFNPLLIVVFYGVLPLLATSYLGKTGILERLTDASTVVEYFAQHGMSPAVVGTAGVVRVISTSPPRQVAPLFRTPTKPGKSMKVMPLLQVIYGISTHVKAKDHSVNSRSIQTVRNREGARNDASVLCLCKTRVPLSQLKHHRTSRCPYWTVTCPTCRLQLPASLLKSHTLLKCRLVRGDTTYDMIP